MQLKSIRTATATVCALGMLAGGCRTPTSGDAPEQRVPRATDHMERARELYDQGLYEEALVELVETAHRHPSAEGLDEMRHRVIRALNEQNAIRIQRDAALSSRRMELDAERHKVLPDTYGMRRYFPGARDPLRTAGAAAQAMLEQSVTLHLENVDLDNFILALGASEGINIVADSIAVDKRMTIHADEVPLREILDYAARNLGVAFYAGENLIWATARPPEEPDTPMQTRIYRLRKGLSGIELDRLKDGEAEERETKIVKAIERFVPKPEGADWMFCRKAHVLIARNTRENLARVEDLLEYLDICPPQVSIEAHFVSASVGDMQELGIDWLMDSHLVTSSKEIMRDGRPAREPRTRIQEGARFPFTPMMKDDEGESLTEQMGMVMTYQGLLTEPEFRAVLHALHLSGKARTLSVPRVTTVNNHAARIRVGEDFPYFDSYKIENILTQITDEGHRIYTARWVPVGEPKVEELGFELVVTPSVGADLESITLQLAPGISEFVRYNLIPVVDERFILETHQNDIRAQQFKLQLPVFHRHVIETEVIARSGETVVMGGLVTQSDEAYEKRVPILSSIPLLGRMFRSDGVRESKENLIIFVTAKLITQRGEDLLPLHDPALSEEEAIRREFFPVSIRRTKETTDRAD